MSNLINADIAFGDETLRRKILPDHRRADASIASNADVVTADDWFALGARVAYDRRAKEILQRGDDTDSQDIVQVFRRIAYAEAVPEDAIWTSFLPGWPDGSFGWAKVRWSGNALAPVREGRSVRRSASVMWVSRVWGDALREGPRAGSS